MGSIAFIFFAALATIFNIYMWYYEVKNKKIFQFLFDIGGTIIIIVLFSAVSATVTGFAIAMIVSATWSLIAILENSARKRRKMKKENKKIIEQLLKNEKLESKADDVKRKNIFEKIEEKYFNNKKEIFEKIKSFSIKSNKIKLREEDNEDGLFI